MSSGFSGGGGGGVGGGGSDFFTTGGGLTGRSSFMSNNNNNNNNPQYPYRSQLAGVSMDPSSQINNRRPNFIGKRTLAEFQNQNLLQQQQQQQQSLYNLPQNLLQQQQEQQRQQQLMGLYLKSVKSRIYQNSSPISPLSPIDFSGSILPEIQPLSSSPANFTGRYGVPMIQSQQLRSHQMNLNNKSFLSNSCPNLVQPQERVLVRDSETETEKKMRSRLLELEKQLLDDDDDNENEHCEDVSAITGSEWSDTIQSLITIPISPTSSSSTSSSSTTVASPAPKCSKQSLMDAASAISEGKIESAAEIIARLSHHQSSNVQGSPEQRMVFYMASALKSRMSPFDNPPPVSELYGEEQMEATQLLFQNSTPFKLGFIAANLAIVEATGEAKTFHVVDFNIGHGLQYQNLLQLLCLRKISKPTLVKITALEDVVNGDKQRLISVGEKLSQLGEQVGISVQFNNISLKITDLSRESLGCDSEEVLVVNFAYTLFRMPDESVSTDNPRDHLLRRVKGLRPRVTTLVEQELNINTTQFVSRFNECCNYYGALFDSLDSSMARDDNNKNNSERVKLEEGLSRKMANSVGCEGRDRVERCEVFGKWRARMGMAGFELKPVSQLVAESLRDRVNSGTRANPGFMVKEENGGVCFGWMGRTLTVASAWL